MGIYESKYAKLNIQSQILDQMIEENEQKLNKECVDTIDKVLNNDFSSRYLHMVEFLKQWKNDIEEEKKSTINMIDINNKITEKLRNI